MELAKGEEQRTTTERNEFTEMRHAEVWSWKTTRPEREDAEIEVRQLLTRHNITISRNEAREQTAVGDHFHRYEQWLHVLKGKGLLICAGREHQLSRGSILRIPANTVHSVIYRRGCVILEFGLGRDTF